MQRAQCDDGLSRVNSLCIIGRWAAQEWIRSAPSTLDPSPPWADDSLYYTCVGNRAGPNRFRLNWPPHLAFLLGGLVKLTPLFLALDILRFPTRTGGIDG